MIRSYWLVKALKRWKYLTFARMGSQITRMIFAHGARLFSDEETHMANMSKSDVLSAVAGSAGCTKADAEAVIEAFFDCVESAAKAGDAVAWPGVGKFSRSDRAARQGRNPQTGATIQIAASSSVKFTAAKALKDRMNG